MQYTCMAHLDCTLCSRWLFWYVAPQYVCKVLRSTCLYVFRVVCLSVYSHISKTTYSNFTKLFVHAVSMALSCNDSVIHYVLPVLWMTSCFHVKDPLGQNQRQRCFVLFARCWHQGEVADGDCGLVDACIPLAGLLWVYSTGFPQTWKTWKTWNCQGIL